MFSHAEPVLSTNIKCFAQGQTLDLNPQPLSHESSTLTVSATVLHTKIAKIYHTCQKTKQ